LNLSWCVPRSGRSIYFPSLKALGIRSAEGAFYPSPGHRPGLEAASRFQALKGRKIRGIPFGPAALQGLCPSDEAIRSRIRREQVALFAFLCGSAHRGGVQRQGRVYSLESREGRIGKPAGGVVPPSGIERARLYRQRSTPGRHAQRAGGGSRVVVRRRTDSDMTVCPRKAAEIKPQRDAPRGFNTSAGDGECCAGPAQHR
jgi:hypothetical protein